MFSSEQNTMIDKLVKELEEENLAIFAGAGLSLPAGYVNWKTLLEPLAKEIQLDIEKENDLVSLAQYYVNENGENNLVQRIIDEVGTSKEPTDNHKILAKLPISTYWTTNYDCLIEDALDNEGKLVDKKFTVEQLTQTKKGRSAILYKMHGCSSLASSAIISKDQYESYHKDYAPFITALSGDLVSKTFLFLGFSFTDPNIDYILSRIRISFDKKQRQHFYIDKKISLEDCKDQSEYDYKYTKQELFHKDLKRFNIKAILINEWSDLTKILNEITYRFRNKNIFISGSADEYGDWNKEDVDDFLVKLGEILIQEGFKITSGLGLGIGNACISGAIKEIYNRKYAKIDDYLTLKPFPQFIEDKELRDKIWKEWRYDILGRSGIALFFMGNKKILNSNEIVNADGVEKEFRIANELGLKIIPIGASGYQSEIIYKEVIDNFDKFYPNASNEFRDAFMELSEKVDNPIQLLSKIQTILKLL